jgi:hypothetical protein
MVDLNLPREVFEDCEVTGGDVATVTVNIAEILKALPRPTGDTRLTLRTITEYEEKELAIGLRPDGEDENVYTFKTFEDSDEKIPDPKIRLDADLRIVTKAFTKKLADISRISDHVILTAQDTEDRGKTFTMSAGGDLAKFKAEMTEGSNVLGIDLRERKVRAAYSLNYLRECLTPVQAVSDVVELSFSTDMPMKVETQELCGHLGRAVLWFAPRIESDDGPTQEQREEAMKMPTTMVQEGILNALNSETWRAVRHILEDSFHDLKNVEEMKRRVKVNLEYLLAKGKVEKKSVVTAGAEGWRLALTPEQKAEEQKRDEDKAETEAKEAKTCARGAFGNYFSCMAQYRLNCPTELKNECHAKSCADAGKANEPVAEESVSEEESTVKEEEEAKAEPKAKKPVDPERSAAAKRAWIKIRAAREAKKAQARDSQ